MTTFTQNIAGVACTVEVESLPAESLAFVIEYGIRQYLQDGAAVSKTFQSGDRKGELKSDDEIAQEKREGVEERLLNLRSATFTRRGTAERQSPEERAREAYIEGVIRTHAAKAKVKLPTKKADPDWWTLRVAEFYKKNQTAVDKEIARQMREQEKIEVDLSGLPSK